MVALRLEARFGEMLGDKQLADFGTYHTDTDVVWKTMDLYGRRTDRISSPLSCSLWAVHLSDLLERGREIF